MLDKKCNFSLCKIKIDEKENLRILISMLFILFIFLIFLLLVTFIFLYHFYL